MKKFLVSVAAFVTTFVGFSHVTDVLFTIKEEGATLIGGVTNIREQVRSQLAEREKFHADYYKALKIYERLTKEEGKKPEDLIQIDINRPFTIYRYLNGHWRKSGSRTGTGSVKEEEVSESGSVILHRSELNETQQSILRRFERIGQCPETLKEYIPGFYDLCKKLVRTGDRDERRSTEVEKLLNGRRNSRGDTPSTHYRLQKLIEEREAAGVR